MNPNNTFKELVQTEINEISWSLTKALALLKLRTTLKDKDKRKACEERIVAVLLPTRNEIEGVFS